jgi:hypothetical protein
LSNPKIWHLAFEMMKTAGFFVKVSPYLIKRVLLERFLNEVLQFIICMGVQWVANPLQLALNTYNITDAPSVVLNLKREKIT